jgi:MerE protein
MKSCEIPAPAQPTFAKATAGRLEKRGMMWVIGAFVFCPCHLPITLSVLAMLLGGTATGIALRAHPFIAGTIVTTLWVAGTWRGFALVRSAQKYAASNG